MTKIAEQRVRELVKRLVRGEEVAHTEISTIVLASGVSFADIERMCDRLAASDKLVPTRGKAERLVPHG